MNRYLPNQQAFAFAGNSGPTYLTLGSVDYLHAAADLVFKWRGFHLAAEYLLAHGNPNVFLCERGIRTYETATRFTLDIAAIPVIHKQSLCPVCIDVSHPAGQRDLVPSLAFAAVAAGAVGSSAWAQAPADWWRPASADGFSGWASRRCRVGRALPRCP